MSVALGSPGVCLEWCTARALAAGATEDEIADVLLVIAPIASLGPVVGAAPDVATALGYDIAAALEDPGGDEPARALVLTATGLRPHVRTAYPLAAAAAMLISQHSRHLSAAS